ncbi:MAG: hypothetical protein L3J59_02135 [Methylococcaceae bacterium]|nr:hypothetical protein [Methylococcaceae bacterium]
MFYILPVLLGLIIYFIYIAVILILKVIKIIKSTLIKATQKNINKLKQKTKNISLKLQLINNKEGLGQLKKLQDRKEKINDILSNRFNSNEVTYIKYMDVLDENYSCFLDNLEKYWLAIKCNNTIDNEFFVKRIQAGKWHSKQEEKTLTQRYELLNNNYIIANKLLFENEKVLLKLDVFLAEIISINSDGANKVKLAKQNLLNISKRINKFA